MPTLRTGPVRAGAFADKVRRVLFAQTRDMIKRGKLTTKEVIWAAGELNRILYEILVNMLKIDKGDVVRVSVVYSVDGGKIKWDLGTLSIEVGRTWERVPEEVINKAIEKVLRELSTTTRSSKTLPYVVKRVAERDAGDIIYSIEYSIDRENIRVGLLHAIPLSKNRVRLRGAISGPIPLIIDEIVENVEPSLDSYINDNIEDIIDKATLVEREEAEKILNEIEKLLK